MGAASADDATLRKKIGQMVMVGFSGSNPDDRWVEQLAADARIGRIGGVLLLARNIENKAQLKRLTAKFRAAGALVAIDEEGGLISRFNALEQFKHFPSAREVGAKYDLTKARATYDAMAAQLREVGVNLNFAPVVDIHDPRSAVIGAKNRAFSAKASEVTAYANEFIDAMHDAHVLTALKYFPGHGGAQIDTHKAKAVLEKYNFDELKPYYDLISRGKADFVMVAHLVVKDLDPASPASLSRKIITGLLKDKLGFEGAVISDDLLMHALDEYGLPERVVRAVNAGSDVVLVTEYFLRQTNSVKLLNDVIFDAVKRGDISESRINDAYNRIKKIKSKIKE